jgi:hypothetical protein
LVSLPLARSLARAFAPHPPNVAQDKASPLGRCALFATLAVPSPELEAKAETAEAWSTLVRGPHLKRERGHGYGERGREEGGEGGQR